MPELTTFEFDAFILGQRAIVHFCAPWNRHDQTLRARLARVRTELPPEITFAAFSCDPPENHEYCRRYQILTIPTLVSFRDGVEVGRIVGLRDVNQLAAEIQAIFGES